MQPTADGLFKFITEEYYYTKDRKDLKSIGDLIKKVSSQYYLVKNISMKQQMDIYNETKKYRDACKDEGKRRELLQIMGLFPTAFASAASSYHKKLNGSKMAPARPVQDYKYASKI